MGSVHVRIDSDLHTPVKVQASIEKLSIQRWLSGLIRWELERIKKDGAGSH